MPVKISGPAPVRATTSKNLVRDGRFLEVEKYWRDLTEGNAAAIRLFSQKAYPDPGHHWSNIWDVDGDTPTARAVHDIELLGKGWFEYAAAHREWTGYPIGWPPVESGDRGFAINTNGWGYGELGQDVDLPIAGMVNLNFLSVRDNIHNCGTLGASFDVELRPQGVTGGESLVATFFDTAHGDWMRRSHDFNIEKPGKYRLIMKGVPNDPISPICGSFVADIVLAYRHKLKALGIQAPIKGSGDNLTLEANANGYFPSFKFFLFDVISGTLLRHFPVTFEIKQPAASGSHFEHQSDSHLLQVESDTEANVVMPATTLRAGSPPASAASDELLVKADGQVIATIKLVVKQASLPDHQGEAETVLKARFAYLSGDAQSAASQTRFRHALSVDVRDAKGGRATKGHVTFKVVNSDNGAAGYLTESEDGSWTTISLEKRTQLDVPVNDGRAKVWLWGQNSSAHPGHLKIEAHVQGKLEPTVAFHENVWPTQTALTLSKEQGDGQTVYQGELPAPLRIRAVRADNTSVGADGEWLHWTIDTPSLMQFEPVPSGSSIEWENGESVWTRTDPDGHASAPRIHVTAGSVGTAIVSVASPVAQTAVFTLNLKLNEPRVRYHLVRVDQESEIAVNTETDVSVKVMDNAGKGVPNVHVRAAVESRSNLANATITPTAPASVVTNQEGVATFKVVARKSGTFALKFETDKAQFIVLYLFATGHLVTSTLTVTLGRQLTLLPGQPTADHPVSIHLSPPDDGIPLVNFKVSPQRNDGLYVWQDGTWVREGNLPFHDSVAYLGKLRIGAASPPNPAEFKIRFTIPGHESTLHDEATIKVGGLAYVQLHPATSSDTNRLKVDSDSEIGNDPSMYVQVYTDSGHNSAAANAQVKFLIDIEAPNHTSDEVAFTEGSKTEHVGTSRADGKCPLPAIKIARNFTGDFRVSVYAGTSSTADGVFYFQALTASPPQVIKFDPDETLKTLHPKVYDEDREAGRVQVYTDARSTVPAHSGTVNFAINASSTATARFAGKDGAYDQQQSSSRINAKGWAKVPPLKVKQEGTLIIDATIGVLSTSHTFTVKDD
ncbi:Ig-like domain-containing protein [Achromobacter sp. EB05]|uniref:Ig-like domain-containing protein n=1 Tax=Achromobacter sp. EB05 TaxID=3142974 RepID=UPI003783CE88